jgi:hypothetical protein
VESAALTVFGNAYSAFPENASIVESCCIFMSILKSGMKKSPWNIRDISYVMKYVLL